VRATEAKLIAITCIQPEDGGVAMVHIEQATDVFEQCVLACKSARLLPLFRGPLLIAKPFKLLEFRQVAKSASRPIAIDTRGPLLEAS